MRLFREINIPIPLLDAETRKNNGLTFNCFAGIRILRLSIRMEWWWWVRENCVFLSLTNGGWLRVLLLMAAAGVGVIIRNNKRTAESAMPVKWIAKYQSDEGGKPIVLYWGRVVCSVKIRRHGEELWKSNRGGNSTLNVMDLCAQ